MDVFGGKSTLTHSHGTLKILFHLQTSAEVVPSCVYVSSHALHILVFVASCRTGPMGSLPLESCDISMSMVIANKFRSFNPFKNNKHLMN